MQFLNSIVNWLESASDTFYDAYLTVSSWIYPFGLLATPLYSLHQASHYSAYYFNQFSNWLSDASQKLSRILEWTIIRSYILSWLPSLEAISNWFSIRWDWLRQELEAWWLSVKPMVQGWITIAIQGLSVLKVEWANFLATTWKQLEQAFDKLSASWHNFWTVVFPNLVNFQWLDIWWQGKLRELNSLIESKLKIWFPFYDDLAEVLNEIKQFFANPIDWIGNKFMDWLEERW